MVDVEVGGVFVRTHSPDSNNHRAQEPSCVPATRMRGRQTPRQERPWPKWITDRPRHQAVGFKNPRFRGTSLGWRRLTDAVGGWSRAPQSVGSLQPRGHLRGRITVSKAPGSQSVRRLL